MNIAKKYDHNGLKRANILLEDEISKMNINDIKKIYNKTMDLKINNLNSIIDKIKLKKDKLKDKQSNDIKHIDNINK
jgi:hypothetical protein